MSSRPQSPPTTLRSPPAMEGPKESAVSRLLIAPLTFISFLLSLALIDSRNHSTRTHSHPPAQPSTILGHIKAFLHRCVYKRTSSSPYAYISESSTSTPGSQRKENGKGDEPWHWHTKQRKMMKAEFSDAYRMRNSIFVLLLAGGVIVLLGIVYGVVGFAGWVRYIWSNWASIGKASLPTHMGGQGDAIMYGEQLASGQRNEI